jgi:ribulose-bisphosphate carboxylase large chain
MDIDEYLFQPDVDEEEHIIATYYVESKHFLKAAKAIAIGQSIGNPEVRNEMESDSILRVNLAKILDHPNNLSSIQKGFVRIAYPLENLDLEQDGITQLLCMLMGGQMDIDIIQACRLENIQYPKKYLQYFKGPKIGMDEIKKRTQAIDRPLIGGIVKPKTGMTAQQLKKVCVEMAKGGIDFIKEDEILGNPKFCTFNERVELCANAVNDVADDQGREIFYAPCINSDYPHYINRAKKAEELGANAIHINFWGGFPVYKSLRDLDLNLAIHYQKSGDKVITSVKNPYSIKWTVLTELARMSGADFIHVGMWGGYLSDSKEDLSSVMASLRNKSIFKKTVPALSCGSHPGLVNTTVKHFGTELMMNVGGALHGHPGGTKGGVIAMRQSAEATMKNIDAREFAKSHHELKQALDLWGYSEE